MDHFPEVLQQDKLVLRPARSRDIGALVQQLNNDLVARWLAAVTRPFNEEAARTLMAHGQSGGEALRLIEWQGQPIGGLCLGSTLWYWMSPAFWRQGLTRQALTLALGAWFSGVVPPLTATSHVDNTASRCMLAGLGFAPLPVGRRMFFHSTGRSEPCQDYVLAPEQWHLLHPPALTVASTTLSPATQKDVTVLSQILSSAQQPPWPAPAQLWRFVEDHRFRGGHMGLFTLKDQNRRVIGGVLITEDATELQFLTPEDKARHRSDAVAALTRWQAR